MSAGGRWGRANGEDGGWGSVGISPRVCVGLSHRDAGRDLWGPDGYLCLSPGRIGRCGGDARKGNEEMGSRLPHVRALALSTTEPSLSFLGGSSDSLPFISAKLHGDFREPSALEFKPPSPSLMLSFEGHWE